MRLSDLAGMVPGLPVAMTSIAVPLVGLLVGIAFAGDAPHTWSVETSLGTLPLGDLSLPAAMVFTAVRIERAAVALSKFRPTLHLRVSKAMLDEVAEAPE